MPSKTPLYDLHVEHEARIVDFGGWDMPLHYGSQVDEHHQVRKHCGLFDVSHMTIVDVEGSQASQFLARLLANDVARLSTNGRALYSCMLNERGGVIDDLIVYLRDANNYRLVVNASTRDKDLQWIQRQAKSFAVEVNEQSTFAMIAVQGPDSPEVFAKVAEAHNMDSLWSKVKELSPFTMCEHNQIMVGRTGYTGENGYEIMMPDMYAPDTWRAFTGQGAVPCGLGSRDTLRIEAGMNLYGTDMDETTTPFESGLAWTVSLEREDRDFIGREALVAQQQLTHPSLCGIILEGRGVLRGGQAVSADGDLNGAVTSGTYSPTLERSIGFVRMSGPATGACSVDIRGRAVEARFCKLPFVRNGTIRIEI